MTATQVFQRPFNWRLQIYFIGKSENEPNHSIRISIEEIMMNHQTLTIFFSFFLLHGAANSTGISNAPTPSTPITPSTDLFSVSYQGISGELMTRTQIYAAPPPNDPIQTITNYTSGSSFSFGYSFDPNLIQRIGDTNSFYAPGTIWLNSDNPSISSLAGCSFSISTSGPNLCNGQQFGFANIVISLNGDGTIDPTNSRFSRSSWYSSGWEQFSYDGNTFSTGGGSSGHYASYYHGFHGTPTSMLISDPQRVLSAPVPEPATALLMAAGGLVLAATRRRRMAI